MSRIINPIRKLLSNGVNPKIWLVITAIWLCISGIATAVERHVPSRSYPTIQAAIDAAVDGDTAIVAPGTYTGDGNRDIDFKGKAITVRSTDPNDPNIVAATIIDCNGTRVYLHRGFYFHSGEGFSSVLAGLTITRGCADYGGGIYNDSSSPMVTNCTFSNNWAVHGGGINNAYSSPTVTACTFTNNSAQYGGGMFNAYNSLTVTGCTFTNNSAEHGGGMFNSHCNSPMVEGCIFTANWAEYGGGIRNWHSSSTITNCTFSRNMAAIYGGGMDNWLRNPTVRGCTFSANYGAGMCNRNYSSPTVTNCIFWADVPSGIYGGTPTVTYSDVQGGWTGIGNINADPCFVNPESNDFHLQPKSPCINAGDPNYVAGSDETDMDGEPRVINGRVDIGEDEFNYEGPVLEISPREFDFYCPEGGPNPEAQVLSIRIRGTNSLNWNVTEDCFWLQANPAAGSSAGEIDKVALSVDANGFEAGNYSCILTVSSPDAINTPQYITVNLHVKKPIIGIEPTAFEFSCAVGSPNPQPQILSIWNADIGTLNWQISEDCSWLQVNSIVGSSTEEVDEVTLSVDVAGLEVGEYSCILTVSSPNAINTPQYVTVNLHVKTTLIEVKPTVLEFSCPWGNPNPEPQILSIWNASIGVLNWQITEDCSWLQASPTTGNSTGDIDKVILTIDAAGLPCGSYICDLTVSDDAAGNSPVTVPVTLIIYLERQLYVPADFPTIQAAIDDANDGDTIIISNGIYSGNGNRDIDFKGKTIIVRSENGPENCIIDCNGTQTEPHRGFYFHSGEDVNAVLDGFTITNGYGGGIFCTHRSSPTIANCIISGNKSKGSGGGVCCMESSNPTVNNCSIIGNSSESGGGGIFMDFSSSTVTNCTFTANSANAGGGMFNNYNSSPTLTNCTFSGNSAGDDGGGGMFNSRSSPTVTICTFSGNSAEYHGGGMFNSESSSNVINCTFSGNSAWGGGGMYNGESSPNVINCTFSGNSANYGGGMHNEYHGSPTVTNCTFSGNSAIWSGGGMYNYQSSPTLTNCTFSGNSTEWSGGGMDNSLYSRPIVNNCTFADNNAPNGQAMACNSYEQKYPSTVTMLNCIIWNGSNWLWNNDNSTINVIYSDVQDGWPGEGNMDADPCFVEMGYWDPNGTPADTNDDFWVEGNYHLLPSSLCINAGDPNFIAGPNDTDMDGEARVMFARVDMGADEFNPIRLGIVSKKRVARTEFAYDCNATFTNLWPFAVTNVELQMMQVPDNMTIIEPNVTFGDIQFNTRQSITSIDTCTFTVDRSVAIDPDKIGWKVKCQRADTGMPIELTIGGVSLPGLESISGDLTGEGKVDFEDLAALAGQWLWVGEAGSIPEDITGDGIVNLRDFAELATNPQ